jgi:hypothetical protein
MIDILFMTLNGFAALVLLLSMVGYISRYQLKLDMPMILSMLTSFTFISLAVMISLFHPLFFAFYAVVMAGSMLFLFRPLQYGIGFTTCFALVCAMFWSETIAWIIFVNMFVTEGKDEHQ